MTTLEKTASTESPAAKEYFLTHPEIYEVLKPYFDAPVWDSDAQPPKVITILFDDFPCAEILPETGLRMLRIVAEERPRTLEVQFDEEPVLFILDDEVLLKRIDEDMDKYTGILKN